MKTVSIAIAAVAGLALVPLGAARAQRHDPRGAIFVEQGCTKCHAVRALGLKAESDDVGPDLTFAYVDVVDRYGVHLREFLADPSGVMRFVLTTHLKLNGLTRDSVADVLEAIYKQHQADAPHEMPPVVADSPPSH
ncbi:MAG TPA: hypothetical protein VLV16_00900 [Gemmatimonadales bacterium]|nr:hypothetical protein [Gemmatimonadales bacterium]